MAQRDVMGNLIGGESVGFVLSAVVALVPLKSLQTKAFTLALLFALLAYCTRIVQSMSRKVKGEPGVSKDRAKSVAIELASSNDVQLAMVCVLLIASHAPNPMHLGMHVGVVYQALVFLHRKMSHSRVWALLRLDGVYAYANARITEAFLLGTQLEIMAALLSIVEVFVQRSVLGPVRPVLLIQWLRSRNKCSHDTVLKVKYPQSQRPSTLHALFWSKLDQRTKPYYSKIPYCEKAIRAVSNWFHGR